VSKNDILTVRDLKKTFATPQGIVRAVDGISFCIGAGETFALVGESGSGKSTAAYTVAGAYRPDEGDILFRGQSIAALRVRPRLLRKEIRIVYQDPGSSLNPRRSVRQILDLPIKLHGDLSRTKRAEKVTELIRLVELTANSARRYSHGLSGGQKQRVAIARALATDPSLVILDEPTSALDVSVQAKIMKLLRDLQEEFRPAYLFITHDIVLMRNAASEVGVMYLGKLCEKALAKDFFENPLHPYARMLMSSIPAVSEAEELLIPKRLVPRGEIPSPIDVPPGCSFHSRCPKRMDTCTQVDPVMVEIGEGHATRCHLYQGTTVVASGEQEEKRYVQDPMDQPNSNC